MRDCRSAARGLLLTLAGTLEAQVIHRIVLDAGSGPPVAGGLVQLLRNSTVIVAATTTNERGHLSLPQADIGRYQLRVLRIGFQRSTSADFRLTAGERLEDTVSVPSVPVILDEVTVEAKNPRRRSPMEDRRMIDIAGALWIDRRSRELLSLEYRYTGLWAWVPKGSVAGH